MTVHDGLRGGSGSVTVRIKGYGEGFGRNRGGGDHDAVVGAVIVLIVVHKSSVSLGGSLHGQACADNGCRIDCPIIYIIFVIKSRFCINRSAIDSYITTIGAKAFILCRENKRSSVDLKIIICIDCPRFSFNGNLSAINRYVVIAIDTIAAVKRNRTCSTKGQIGINVYGIGIVSLCCLNKLIFTDKENFNIDRTVNDCIIVGIILKALALIRVVVQCQNAVVEVGIAALGGSSGGNSRCIV